MNRSNSTTIGTSSEKTTAVEEVMYKYADGGHPFAAVRKLASDPTFRALRMNYDAGGKLWLAESWDWILDEFDLATVQAADAATAPWRRVTRPPVRFAAFPSGR